MSATISQRDIDDWLVDAASLVDMGLRDLVRKIYFTCRHCRRSPEQHVGQKCLFEATSYTPKKKIPRAALLPAYTRRTLEDFD